MKQLRLFPTLSFLSLFLSGCMVGPKYVKPSVPLAPEFKEQAPESFKEADGWKPAQPGDRTLRGYWWEIFGDSQLNALEGELTLSNQDLKAAEARLREARATIRFNRSQEFPTISTSPSIANERESSNEPYFPVSEAANNTNTVPLACPSTCLTKSIYGQSPPHRKRVEAGSSGQRRRSSDCQS